MGWREEVGGWAGNVRGEWEFAMRDVDWIERVMLIAGSVKK
jgi:hypothetical protein